MARQDRFYEKRMQRSREQQKEADKRQLEQEIHLVKAPGALAKEKEAKLKGGCWDGQGWKVRECVCTCVACGGAD